MILAILIAMVTAGLFAVDVDGIESGPLAGWISFDQGRTAFDLHKMLFNLLLALVALHVAAVLYYVLRLHHNLIGPMIHGRRTLPVEEAVDLASGSPWKVIVGLLVAAACTWATGFL
ncbi:hypothetical protein U5A82_04715 [Sphingobium sp. CR2-8]|uniref:hypothetical protein n=1 Tax=Sphingobium sp. CR2-8 TaxID=1306534 RepID=UPI002DBAB063|nr:hypothetical protein [Sphingobium sp. CR2-8]MEC3909794.1 hypothetical protein [Sphingobium sp. CR2-8]